MTDVDVSFNTRRVLMFRPAAPSGSELTMTYLTLFFVAAVYLLNGLTLLGRVDARGAAPINILVGLMLLIVTGYLLFPIRDLSLPESRDIVISSIGYPLFAFTFLYVGIGNYTNDAGVGLGWYCGWAALVSAFVAMLNFFHFSDVRYGMLWVVWSVVFAAFFMLSVLNAKRLTRPVGWFVVVAGFTTCAIPGALEMAGYWKIVPAWISVISGLATIAVLLLLSLNVEKVSQSERQASVRRMV